MTWYYQRILLRHWQRVRFNKNCNIFVRLSCEVALCMQSNKMSSFRRPSSMLHTEAWDSTQVKKSRRLSPFSWTIENKVDRRVSVGCWVSNSFCMPSTISLYEATSQFKMDFKEEVQSLSNFIFNSFSTEALSELNGPKPCRNPKPKFIKPRDEF